jgi:uncharacterized phage protein (TIGR01671 family)
MNREIKFRAFCKTTMQMLDVNVNDGKPVKKGYQWFNEGNTVHNAELLQFTGLKDRNGKDIYEGDICKILYTDWMSKPSEDKRTIAQYMFDIAKELIVVYDTNGFYFAHLIGAYSQSMEVGAHGFIEVIGNIYQPILTNEV